MSPSDNKELIFTRGQNQSGEGINVMVVHQLPRIANGWNTHGLTQKQCDAYYMRDGSDCPGKVLNIVSIRLMQIILTVVRVQKGL